MLKDEKFAMYKHILALAVAGALFLGAVDTLQAEARPLGGGWGGGRADAGSGGPRFKGSHQGHGRRFHPGPLVVGDIGSGGGRYLSDDSWDLSDIGGYLADDEPYPDPGSYGYDYWPSAYAGPVRHSYRPAAVYAVPAYRSRYRWRSVRVYRGTQGRVISHAAFRPRHILRP